MYRSRLFLLLFCLCLCISCSKQFIYNQLDWLIPWYVDDYVDLTLVQKEDLDKQVDMLLRWHRGEELTRYITLLEHIERDITGEVTVENVEKWVDEVLVAAKRVQKTILPSAIKLGEDLSDDQMAEFTDNLWQRHKELEKEYLSRSNEEYIKDNYENLTDNLSKYVGVLSAAQKERLNKAARTMQRLDKVWLEDRKNWLEKIEGLLKREPGWQQAILAAYEAREELKPKRLKQYVSYNTNIISVAIADVLNEMSETQRSKLKTEITEIKNEFQIIIASAE